MHKGELQLIITIDQNGSPKMQVQGNEVCACPECLAKMVMDLSKTVGLFLGSTLKEIMGGDYKEGSHPLDGDGINAFCMSVTEIYFHTRKNETKTNGNK